MNNTATLGMFSLFADLIGQHLENQERLAASEAALLSEREARSCASSSIAVLGHDLRNPLASIQAGCRLIGRTELSDKAVSIVGLMNASVDRMAGLINDVLDFARVRLGGGFEVERRPDPALAQALEVAVAELRLAHPDRVIDDDIALAVTVSLRQHRPGGAALLQPAGQCAVPRGGHDAGEGARTGRGRGLHAQRRQRRAAIHPDTLGRLFPAVQPERRPGRTSRAWAWGSISAPRSPGRTAAT